MGNKANRLFARNLNMSRFCCGIGLKLAPTDFHRKLVLVSVTMCLALIASWTADNLFGKNARKVIETGNLHHIAIIGKGYLRAVSSDEEAYYFQSCVLGRNEIGQLSTYVAGKCLVIEPSISIPVTASKVLVSSDGRVCVIEPGHSGTLISVGQITFSQLLNQESASEISPGFFSGENITAISTQSFGDDKDTVLMQGWVDSNVYRASCSQKKSNKVKR